jgi:hypothetical protein
MGDQWTERLSEYMDGELSEVEQAAVEAHVATCGDCAETLAALRRVVARAGTLEDGLPTRDLWPGVAQRIGAERKSRRHPHGVTFSVPQLLAAGIALMVGSGGLAWLLHPDAGPPPVAAVAPAAGSLPVMPAGTGTAAPSYDSAVDDLERILREGRGRLDTATVRVLEQNLALIDRAIAQARHAVAADSANVYLNSHLAETMRRKIDLLRQAAALVSAVS